MLCVYITSFMANPSTNASSTEKNNPPMMNHKGHLCIDLSRFPSDSKNDIAKSGCTTYPNEAGYTQVRRLGFVER